MGLDMYAYVADDRDDNGDWINKHEIMYWRKHPNLHGWMENLWKERGDGPVTGEWNEFNCIEVILDGADIERLEADILGDHLPETSGFFFGTSTPDDKEADLKFIERAKGCIAQGKIVFYDSWW